MLRFSSVFLSWKLLIVGALWVLPGSQAESAEPWVRIEEDWTLAIGEPDPRTYSPQVTLYLTPDANQVETYFQLQLNHAVDTEFTGGGFQVGAFQRDQALDQVTSRTRGALNVTDDVITWTAVLAVQDHELLFAIKNGRSEAWGEFGGPDYLLRMPAKGIQNLSHYTPRRSVADVDLGFGRNRIRYLRLERVRAYRQDGTVFTVLTNLVTAN